MVIEPSEENLVRGKSQELIQSLSVLKQTIQFRMKLDINFAKQTTLDNLPDKSKNQVLTTFHKILGTNVNNRASDSLGRVDHDIVVLGHLEAVDLLASIKNTLINGVRNGVVDEFTQNQTI
jgi:hypothetical protein